MGGLYSVWDALYAESRLLQLLAINVSVAVETAAVASIREKNYLLQIFNLMVSQRHNF